MKAIIEKLTKNKQTISTMESCTGGGIANEITNTFTHFIRYFFTVYGVFV